MLGTGDGVLDVAADDAEELAPRHWVSRHGGPRQPDSLGAMAPPGSPGRATVGQAAQVGPIAAVGVEGGVLEGNAFGCSACELITPGGRGQRRQSVRVARRAVGHAIERAVGTGWHPASPTRRPGALLGEQMPPAVGRPLECVAGPGLAIQPKQTQDGAGTAAQDVELAICRDDVLGDQLRRGVSIEERLVVVEQRRDDREAVNDRSEAKATAETEASEVPRIRAPHESPQPGQRSGGEGL